MLLGSKKYIFKSSSGGELHIHFSTKSKRKYSGYDGFGQEIKPTYGYGQNMGTTSCSMHGLLLSTCSPDRFRPLTWLISKFLCQAPLTLTPQSLPVPCKKGTSRNIPKGSDGGYNITFFVNCMFCESFKFVVQSDHVRWYLKKNVAMFIKNCRF